ncbi:uncharacterized protein LOC133659724 [Entelurus aequoreus]|uniref:uncharacterized protein LOC133659724 n=1 Tax=Entelurus aequoreus TaxID=161455 RepID=UPI002B1CE7D0|nr:uncharacterized protein LOC133659724 [Entelurus aequoreus]
MSLTMTRSDGVTVMTLTSNSKSRLPPLCQILCGLCYSPFCCSVSQHLRAAMGTSQSTLGALHIMVGLLNIGLGTILLCTGPASWWQMNDTAFPEWLGGLFILFGIVCILSEKYPSPCLVTVNVILNMVGVAFAITAIVLYILNLTHINLWYMCGQDRHDYYWGRRPTPEPTMSASEERMKERCMQGKYLFAMLVTGINGVLIVLAALELCLTISSCVLSIKALRRNDQPMKSQDPEKYSPLLEEDHPCA